MRVAIVHNEVHDPSSLDEADVLAQVEVVKASLTELGHTVSVTPAALDLRPLVESLVADRPDVVFQLVEALGGRGRLIHVVPYVLEGLGIPYTGASAEAVLLTSNKLLAKERLLAGGLPTPPWLAVRDGLAAHGPGASAVGGDFPSGAEGGPMSSVLRGDFPSPRPARSRWIVKSVWEHASIGMDDAAVVEIGDVGELFPMVRDRAGVLGGYAFAEGFVDGRELNVGILDGEVLPPAEIRFNDYPEGKPKIVGYNAKWKDGTFEYLHTERSFDFPAADAPMLQRARELAMDCWRVFGLSGYARVDFRVTERGAPIVLEINTNPCLSPDAGFAAALERAGIPFTEAVRRIVASAHRPV